MSLSFTPLWPTLDRGLKMLRAECSLATCHNRQLVGRIPGVRHGIQVGPQWYCSVDCFAMGSRAALAALAQRHSIDSVRRPRLSLGLALLSKGHVTAEDLRVATANEEPDEEQIAAKMIRLGLATEKQVAAARSAQWGYPVFARDFADAAMECDIPRRVLDTYMAAPLYSSATAKRILLGFVLRVEHHVLESIEQMTGCRVEPCFITRSDREEQLQRISAPEGYGEMVIANPGPVEKMARTIGRAAVQVAARTASFTRCRNDIWVRITGKRGKVDAMFCLSPPADHRTVENLRVAEEIAAI